LGLKSLRARIGEPNVADTGLSLRGRQQQPQFHANVVMCIGSPFVRPLMIVAKTTILRDFRKLANKRETPEIWEFTAMPKLSKKHKIRYVTRPGKLSIPRLFVEIRAVTTDDEQRN
jgi:hypothetical protein